jgi:hypothetical protein
VDELFAWLRTLLAKWCWIWVPHSGSLSLHLPDPSMPSSSGKHSVPLALFPRGILPARLVTFLTISTSLKMVSRFFTVMCEHLQWYLDTSDTALKLFAQILWQLKLHRIYVKRYLIKRSRPLIGGTLGGIEHLPLNKKRSVFSCHIQVIMLISLHVIDLRFNVYYISTKYELYEEGRGIL